MNVAITNAHVVPVEGEPFDGTIVITDGKIAELGADVSAPSGHEVIDAGGRWVLPGLIDAHVHLGVWEEGEGWAGQDTNECTDPVTAGVRALDAINPTEQGFDDALSGGITSVNVLPGSGNAIGGMAVAMKTHGRMVDEMVMRFPSGLKSALGENPKRVYGDRNTLPSTRLGTAYVIRKSFVDAQNYQAKLDAAEDGKPVDRDLLKESLCKVLNREIPWRQHSHRADDIATALRMADEFGYELVLDHGTEAWKLPDVLADKGVPVLYGPMIVSRSKVEVRERTPAAPGILSKAGVKVAIITDHPVVPIEFLISQVSLAVKEGMDYDEAIKAVTINPAQVLGVDDRVGSLKPGKDGDVVLWSGDPLDTRNRALRVFIEGKQVYSYDEETREATVAER